jgi:predicted enzyme related to lactoylglutathione lyase
MFFKGEINMFSNLTYLLFSEKPKQLAEFYEKVIGKPPEWNGGDFVGWIIGNTFFTIGPHDQVKGKNQTPERMIFNFESMDVEEDFKRIRDLGAKVVAEPYHPGESDNMWISTFTDPDNNYFQLVSPMIDETPRSN